MIGNRPEHIKKKSKLVMNIVAFALMPIILLSSNVEPYLIFIIIIPCYFSLQHLFEGDMTFVERWFKMVKIFMIYSFIVLAITVIIENFLPSIAPILYYTIK